MSEVYYLFKANWNGQPTFDELSDYISSGFHLDDIFVNGEYYRSNNNTGNNVKRFRNLESVSKALVEWANISNIISADFLEMDLLDSFMQNVLFTLISRRNNLETYFVYAWSENERTSRKSMMRLIEVYRRDEQAVP